ncbi:hypothetical protein SAMN05216412_1102 [Nitrosospira multiformis]|uniref:Uncharacterized protein n=2 Tax=Nitrosospira multiformis TaxID=1231 RepID=A0A1I0FS69_9PROT|nr:hypothetical protein SAMN05216412_1102 [Nitrosospira multiformis]
MNYENRVVAYIDIIGFKSLLDQTVKDNQDDIEKIKQIIRAYDLIKEILEEDAELNKLLANKSSRQVTIFSDLIVISFKANEPGEVFYTLLQIKHIIMGLLNLGLLCRGAVTKGKLIHKNEYIFGPALVEAYMLETKAALYPRVILERKIVEIGAKHRSPGHILSEERKYVESLLEMDSDGMYYVDYFFKAHQELDDPDYDFPAYIDNLGKIIRKGLMSSTHHFKADIRIKYSWMRERYNEMVDTVTGKREIAGLQRMGLSELAEFYSKLNKISGYKH